jgi:hypothetical protein
MLAAEPRLIGHNDELIQLPDGKIYKKVENPNGIDPTKLPFGNPKLLSAPKPDDDPPTTDH